MRRFSSLFICMLLTLTLSAISTSAQSTEPSCSAFNAVYVPSPPVTGPNGIHYSLWLEDDNCAQKPCSAAQVHLDTLDKNETALTRLTMQYLCMGTAWSCRVSLSCTDKCDHKMSDHIVFDAVGLDSSFKSVSLLGDKNKAAHALIFPAMDIRFRYAAWNKFASHLQIFTKTTLPLPIAAHLETPPIWVFNKCNR
jgi:hypothetical protein